MRFDHLVFLACLAALRTASGGLVRDLPSLQAALGRTPPATSEFDLTAKILLPCTPQDKTFFVTDGTNAVLLVDKACWPRLAFAANDLVRVKGRVQANGNGDCLSVEVVGKAAPEPVTDASVAEVVRGLHERRLVRVRGIVRTALQDEIDSGWSFITILDQGAVLQVEFMPGPQDVPALPGLIGAEVLVTGLAAAPRIIKNSRRFYPASLKIRSLDDVRVIRPAPKDPFAAPALTDVNPFLTPSFQDERRSAVGCVLATYDEKRLVLKTVRGAVLNVELADGRRPSAGDGICVVGYPATDVYRLNLTDAIWRAEPSAARPPEAPEDVRLGDLLTDGKGHVMIKPAYHGRAIRIRGIVRTAPETGHSGRRLNVESGGHLLPVDVSSCPQAAAGFKPGCVAEFSGVCIMPTENWHPNNPLPRIRDVFLAVRTPADIRLLRAPSPWTPRRFLAVIAALAACLLAVFLWNLLLARRVERRSRELLDEQVARVTSELKTLERTSLAIELHDSLAQSLTGVALRLQSARETVREDPPEAARHLEAADRALLSCREELRNCLRDLREETLEDGVIDQAIRTTLEPHCGTARVNVRFNVPRARMTDSTLHTVLRIIRELVLNAVRHGRAQAVSVAGTLEGDRLLFSVSDNGCGFDPARRPGPRDGHFGLQGVHERIRRLDGKLDIRSAPGHGAKVTVSLSVRQEDTPCRR